MLDWINISLDIDASDILSVVALLIASFGAYVSWKSHKRTLLLLSPAIDLPEDPKNDDVNPIHLTVFNNGPRVNRILMFGFLSREGKERRFHTDLYQADEPLAPGDRIVIEIPRQQLRQIQTQHETTFVGVFVRDIDGQTEYVPIRKLTFQPITLKRRQLLRLWSIRWPYLLRPSKRPVWKAKQFNLLRSYQDV